MKKFAFLFSFLLILSACGEIEVSEEIPPVGANITGNLNENDEDSNENSSDNITTEEIACSADDMEECEEKTDACISDLQASNIRIKSLENTIEKLQKRTTPEISTGDKLKEFIIEYIKNVPQKEYAFNLCGRMTSFSGQTWYSDFQSSLTDASILFKLNNKPLEAGDFFGGCMSNEGKIAFFLGAGFQNETEFHLLKFDFENKILEPVTIAGGNCQDCPVEFGKRNGPYVELIGNSNTNFRYYFDKNLLVEGKDF